MSESIEETLRKSKEVAERYQKFLKNKEKSDADMKETELRIANTHKTLKETQKHISDIDDTYQKFKDLYSLSLDKAFESLRLSIGGMPMDDDFKP